MSVKGLGAKIDEVKGAIDEHSRASLEELREYRKEVIEVLKNQAKYEKPQGPAHTK